MVHNYKHKVPIVGMGTAKKENEARNIDETWATGKIERERKRGGGVIKR